jgi:chromosome segregation ATPase
MRMKRLRLGIGIALLILICAGAVGLSSAYGHEGASDSTSTPATAQSRLQRAAEQAEKLKEHREELVAKRQEQRQKTVQLKERVQSARSTAQDKSQERRQQVCIQKVARVKKNLSGFSEHAKARLDRDAAIADKVFAYYETKLVPAGVAVADYADRRAAIAAWRSELEAAVAQAKASAETFSCESEDPKESLGIFKEGVQGINTALKGLRTEARELVVEIRKAAKGVRPSASPSADSL